MDLKLGDVSPATVLSKFMENGEWDFHHVEGRKHSSRYSRKRESFPGALGEKNRFRPAD